MTPQGAVNILRQFEALGSLHADTGGQGIVGRWYAEEVLDVLDPGRR
jgi:hypothetical protein